MSVETPKPPRRWFDGMFQMRFGFFMFAVAGCALIFWAYLYYRANTDPERSYFSLHLAQLKSSDPIVRKYAAQSLDRMSAAQLSDGSKALIVCLRDADPAVRVAAIGSLSTSIFRSFRQTLGELPPERDEVATALIAALGDGEPRVRMLAAQTLISLGRPTNISNGKLGTIGLNPKLVPEILKVFNDPDPRIVRDSVPLLFVEELNIEPATRIAIIRRLDAEARNFAVSHFGMSRLYADSSPDEVLAFVDDPDMRVRATVLKALRLRKWNHPAKIVETLAPRLRKADPGETRLLVLALSNYTPPPDEAVPIMIELLKEECEKFETLARSQPELASKLHIDSTANNLAFAISHASPEVAKSALPVLVRTALNKTRASRDACEALIRIAPDSPETRSLIPLFVADIQKELDPETGTWSANRFFIESRRSAEALIKIAPESPEARDLVTILAIELRSSVNDDTKTWDAMQLAALGPYAADAVTALQYTVGHPDDGVRRAVCFALEQIGPEARSAIPALARAVIGRLEEEFEPFAGELIDTILALDPDCPEASSVLLCLAEVSESPIHSDRRQAKSYLDNIDKTRIANNPTLRNERQSADLKRKARAESLLKTIESR